MINVTLDTNCIIDLEEDRATAPYIRELIRTQEEGNTNLGVPAISASERKPNGKYATNFAEFQQKIAAVGLGNVNILKPIGYWDVTFWDWCLYADKLDPLDANLEREIHQSLFPEIEFAYSGEVDKRWRNAKCDVLALWSHIHYGSGIFVTMDSNFHQKTKKSGLLALGAGEILKPEDAASRLNNEILFSANQ